MLLLTDYYYLNASPSARQSQSEKSSLNAIAKLAFEIFAKLWLLEKKKQLNRSHLALWRPFLHWLLGLIFMILIPTWWPLYAHFLK